MQVLDVNSLTIRLADNPEEQAIKIRYLTQVSKSLSVEVEEVTTKDTDRWREIIRSLRAVSLSFSGFLNLATHNRNTEYVSHRALSGETVHVEFQVRSTIFSGSGIVTNLDVGQSTNDPAPISGTIEISGEFLEEILTFTDILLDHQSDPLTDHTGEALFGNNII